MPNAHVHRTPIIQIYHTEHIDIFGVTLAIVCPCALSLSRAPLSVYKQTQTNMSARSAAYQMNFPIINSVNITGKDIF